MIFLHLTVLLFRLLKISADSICTARRNATRQFFRVGVGVGGVN